MHTDGRYLLAQQAEALVRQHTGHLLFQDRLSQGLASVLLRPQFAQECPCLGCRCPGVLHGRVGVGALDLPFGALNVGDQL